MKQGNWKKKKDALKNEDICFIFQWPEKYTIFTRVAAEVGLDPGASMQNLS